MKQTVEEIIDFFKEFDDYMVEQLKAEMPEAKALQWAVIGAAMGCTPVIFDKASRK